MSGSSAATGKKSPLPEPDETRRTARERFFELFPKLRKRLLDNAEFEYLLQESVERIDVFTEKIAVETPSGRLALPRIAYKNRKIMPSFTLAIRKADGNPGTAPDFSAAVSFETGFHTSAVFSERVKICGFLPE